MFLLHCNEDDSLVICSESEVIFEDSVKKGEEVQFFYSGKEYLGTIIDRSDNEKELKDIRQKIRAQKQRSKQMETVSLKQPIYGKRTRIQNKIYKDCAGPSLMKRSGDKQQSVPSKKWKKSFERDTFTAKNAKYTQLSGLLDNNSESANESLSSTSSEEYNKFIISQMRKQTEKKKYHKKIKNNSSKFENLHGTFNARMYKENFQENLSPIEENSMTDKEDNSQKDSALIENSTNVPPTVFTEVTTPTNNNFTKKSCLQINDKSCGTSSITETIHIDNALIGNSTNVPPTMFTEVTTPTENNVTQTSCLQINDKPCGTSSITETIQRNKEKSDPKLTDNTDILQVRQLDQLYGKDWPNDTMVMLRDEIYCRQSVLCAALGASSKASHLVRRLLLGVFKQDAICRTTLTGRAPRAAGRNQNVSVQLFPLEDKAKNAIIKYSKSVAKMKGWSKQSTRSLLFAITQRIGEIKREARKAN